MSGSGFFYSPEDEQQLSALKRKQALAQSLLSGGDAGAPGAAYSGLANAGNKIIGAILANKLNKQEQGVTQGAQQKYQSDLANFLKGITPQPAAPTPQPPSQISNNGGAGAPAPAPAGMPPPQATNTPGGPQSGGQPPAPMPQPPPAQSPLGALAGTGNIGLMQQFAPALVQHQLEANDRRMTPVSAQEMEGLGFRKGTVGERDAFGNISVKQESDLKSPEAIQQQQDMLRNQPQTPEQRAQIGLGYAKLNKPVEVGFGSSLVDPKTGQVKYEAAPDASAIKLGAQYFIENGGQYPPNARSPMMQQAIGAEAAKEMQAQGLTMADLVNRKIGIHGRQGAATQLGKQQAGTMVNEDTVNGGMNILNGLLKKGAGGPSSITGINDLQQWAARNTNNPDAANLYNAVNTISNEYARVMTGNTTGSASSDSARNEAAKRLVLGYNKGTMQAVMGQMHQEMGQRSTAQGGALSQVTGGQYGGVKTSIPYADPNAAPTPNGSKVLRYDANGNRIPGP